MLMTSESSARDQFHEALASFAHAMLVTRTPEGVLRARPMAIADIDQDECVWFTTSEQSGKIDEISADPHVCVTFQEGHHFLSLSGEAELVHDREKIRQLWSEAWRPWFPGGADDPNLVLLCVGPREGELWDRSGLQGLKYLFEAVHARIGRRQMQEDKRLHQRIQL
jgi:general stress protein 26